MTVVQASTENKVSASLQLFWRHHSDASGLLGIPLGGAMEKSFAADYRIPAQIFHNFQVDRSCIGIVRS